MGNASQCEECLDSTELNARALAVKEEDHLLLATPQWREQLQKFSFATGLNLAVFDLDGSLCFPVILQSPLARRLAAVGTWENPASPCLEPALKLARQALRVNGMVTGKACEMLALFALPLRLNETLKGALVAGWVYDHFPDPVGADRLARTFNIFFPELWQIVRQQQPITREKLKVYAELLQTLADSYLIERARTIQEQERSRELSLLNQTSRQMSAATTAEEIRACLVNTIKNLTSAEEVRFIHVGSEPREAASGLTDNHEENMRTASGHLRLITTSLRVPVETADGVLLGAVEIINSVGLPAPGIQMQVTTLAAQAAVALQKIQLIQELKSERAELQAANKAKDEFLSVLSHELRTPLNPILGWIRMLRRDSLKLDSERIAEVYDAIERNALRELQLIEEILDLSRILNNKIQFDLTQIDPADVLARLVTIAQTMIGDRPLHLRMVTGENLPWITVDLKRIEQALSNLIVNAIKFTPDGGTITLGLQAAENNTAVEFYVSDTGIGINPEDISLIFDRFRQADSSTRRRFDGLGIGLSVVRGLVEMHGGRVWATSEGEGQGATFTVQLPAAKPMPAPTVNRTALEEASTPAPDSSSDSAATLQPARLLVVDDVPDTLRMMEFMLTLQDYEVVTAASVDEALALARQRPPDLIITDLGMPEKDGYDLLKMVQEDAQLSRIPVVALSGYTNPGEVARMQAAGFLAHLPKPVVEEDLLGILRQWQQAKNTTS
ncbi:MAG TPA: ATP-binding protein [Blastocatellia bacterium]|nr:ATP-binding protein [Blastocatellia bacterium]